MPMRECAELRGVFRVDTNVEVKPRRRKMAFDTKSIAKAREYVDRAREKMARIREHAEEAIGTGIQIAEVGGTAFGFGYANSRWGKNGEVQVMGIPADLGVAVALHGVAFMGGLGKYSEHGHNVGTGALAAYSYRMGSQLGAAAAQHSYAGAQPASFAQPGAAPFINGAQQHAVSGFGGLSGVGTQYTVHAGQPG
jgi:hypothetical protein